MRAIFRVTCAACGCAVELNTESAELDAARRCPNCHQTMASEDIERLNDAISALRRIREDPRIWDEGYDTNYRGFSFAIQPYPLELPEGL